MSRVYKSTSGLEYKGDTWLHVARQIDADRTCLLDSLVTLETQIETLQDKISTARMYAFALREMLDRESYVTDDTIKYHLTDIIKELSGVDTEELRA